MMSEKIFLPTDELSSRTKVNLGLPKGTAFMFLSNDGNMKEISEIGRLMVKTCSSVCEKSQTVCLEIYEDRMLLEKIPSFPVSFFESGDDWIRREDGFWEKKEALIATG